MPHNNYFFNKYLDPVFVNPKVYNYGQLELERSPKERGWSTIFMQFERETRYEGPKAVSTNEYKGGVERFGFLS